MTSAATNSTAPATSAQLEIFQADYANPEHAAALVNLLDAYAQDPAGGGEGLSDFAKSNLIAALAARPQAYSVLALQDGKPVGLVNCIEGFSTFACKPLVNVHDVAVLSAYRGRRIGEHMLVVAEDIARQRGACKLTLEVLQGNPGAIKLYQRIGFAAYELDPAMGSAQFFQKLLD